MAYDGIMMSQVKKELSDILVGGHVSQVHMPNKDEIVIHFRTRTQNVKLLISTRADSPRVHLIEKAPENPQSPPMLCMLLRKYLSSAKLMEITQPENERMFFFVFSRINDLGEQEKVSLCVEIMGKYSNAILVDKGNKVIDVLKRVDLSMSRERILLPKMDFEFPKSQDKLQLNLENIDEIINRVNSFDGPLDKALLSTIQGISPIVCREIEYKVNTLALSLKDELVSLSEKISSYETEPTMVYKENGAPMDVSFVSIKQYGDFLETKSYENYSCLLEDFYIQKDIKARTGAKTHALNKLLNNTLERLSKKISVQQKELEKCKNREELRIKADLLQANLYKIEKGSNKVVVENYYDDNKPIIIELNPAIPPSVNAQKYYKKYAKAKTAEKELTKQISLAKDDLAYIESVIETLSRAKTEKEITLIKEELSEEGYLKYLGRKNKKEQALLPIEYVSKSGYKIYVGRNNKQNDKLTLKFASKSDIWLHTKDIPGSHVIIITNGNEVDDETIKEAAMYAATHSKGRNSSSVPVDYTKVKYVSKPNGAKPGKVIYINYKTVYVTPKIDQK